MKARVIFLNRYFHPDESATSQLLSDLCIALAAEGFAIHVICSRQLYDQADARLISSEDVHAVRVHRVWSTRFGRNRLIGRALDYMTFYVSSMLNLGRLLRRDDIVVAKTDPPLMSIPAAAVARLKGAHLVNWLQDIFPEVASRLHLNPLPQSLDRWLRRLRDASLRAAASNVVLGLRMRDYLVGRGVPDERIQVIENWANMLDIQPRDAESSALRARLGLKGKFVVGYSGNLGRAHDHRTLLDAMVMLHEDPAVEFLMIGGGANMARLRAEVDARRLGNVRFMPYQPRAELNDSLAAPDLHLITLIPALEGLIVPSKIYGILAAGRPVLFVGDKEGELARVIEAMRCGAVVESGQPEQLAKEIRRLHEHAEEREAMGAASRTLGCEKYSLPRAVQSWITLLEQINPACVVPR